MQPLYIYRVGYGLDENGRPTRRRIISKERIGKLTWHNGHYQPEACDFPIPLDDLEVIIRKLEKSQIYALRCRYLPDGNRENYYIPITRKDEKYPTEFANQLTQLLNELADDNEDIIISPKKNLLQSI